MVPDVPLSFVAILRSRAYALRFDSTSDRGRLRRVRGLGKLATNAGAIVTCRLLDARVIMRSGGYLAPVAVLPGTDGLSVFVVEAGGSVAPAAADAFAHVSRRAREYRRLYFAAGRLGRESQHSHRPPDEVRIEGLFERVVRGTVMFIDNGNPSP